MKSIKYTKWWIFAITSMANLTAAFAINSLNLALPSIVKEFGVTQGAVSWLALVYSLIPCCTLLFFGKTADLYGYKRQYIIGFSFFALASLFAPIFSHGLLTLIVFRCLQGIGYSILISITQATISVTFDDHERGKAIGVNSVFVSIGLASGPVVGGILLAHFSWHSIFYFLIPSCVLGFIATLVIMPADADRGPKKRELDWLGGIYFAAAIGTLAIGMNFSDEWGFDSVPFGLCVAVFAGFFLLFIRKEKRTPTPLMPLQLFKNKTFANANAACAFSYMTQQMSVYLLPFFLVNILLLKSDISGFILLSFPLTMMITSPLGGSLFDRYGTRPPVVAGFSLIVLSSVLVGFFKENIALTFVVLVSMWGAGSGLSVPAVNSAILGSAPREYAGVASGMLATMRNVGNTFGTAIASVIIMMRQTHYGLDAGLSDNTVYLMAQRDTFLVGAFLALSAIFLVMRIPRKTTSKNPLQNTALEDRS
jgi:EmrB/QacA subfamily drug resistance transporter